MKGVPDMSRDATYVFLGDPNVHTPLLPPHDKVGRETRPDSPWKRGGTEVATRFDTPPGVRGEEHEEVFIYFRGEETVVVQRMQTETQLRAHPWHAVEVTLPASPLGLPDSGLTGHVALVLHGLRQPREPGPVPPRVPRCNGTMRPDATVIRGGGRGGADQRGVLRRAGPTAAE